jgi:hypothetical protein
MYQTILKRRANIAKYRLHLNRLTVFALATVAIAALATTAFAEYSANVGATSNMPSSSARLFDVTFEQVGACANKTGYSFPWGVTFNGQSQAQPPPSATFASHSTGQSFGGSGGGTVNQTQLNIKFQVPPGAYNYSIQGDFFPSGGFVQVNDSDVSLEVVPYGLMCYNG